MFGHLSCDRRDVDHLVPMGLWIVSLQQGAAAAAGLGVVIQHVVAALYWQQLRTDTGVPLLAAALATTALAADRRLKTLAITGGRL
jgi:hypothetical protein